MNILTKCLSILNIFQQISSQALANLMSTLKENPGNHQNHLVSSSGNNCTKLICNPSNSCQDILMKSPQREASKPNVFKWESLKVFRIHHLETMTENLVSSHQVDDKILLELETKQAKMKLDCILWGPWSCFKHIPWISIRPHLGAKGKVGESQKSSGFILWEPWLTGIIIINK